MMKRINRLTSLFHIPSVLSGINLLPNFSFSYIQLGMISITLQIWPTGAEHKRSSVSNCGFLVNPIQNKEHQPSCHQHELPLWFAIFLTTEHILSHAIEVSQTLFEHSN
jgi:hypothetical protein